MKTVTIKFVVEDDEAVPLKEAIEVFHAKVHERFELMAVITEESTAAERIWENERDKWWEEQSNIRQYERELLEYERRDLDARRDLDLHLMP